MTHPPPGVCNTAFKIPAPAAPAAVKSGKSQAGVASTSFRCQHRVPAPACSVMLRGSGQRPQVMVTQRSQWWCRLASFPATRRGLDWATETCRRSRLTFSSYRDQLDTFAGDEIEGFVHVVDFMHSHFSPLRFWQSFPWKGEGSRTKAFCLRLTVKEYGRRMSV